MQSLILVILFRVPRLPRPVSLLDTSRLRSSSNASNKTVFGNRGNEVDA
jgi:hypothetical protein